MNEEFEPHVQRMIEEHTQLKDKVTKLTNFLATEAYKELSEPERDMLATQLSAMGAYFGILTIRLRMAGVGV